MPLERGGGDVELEEGGAPGEGVAASLLVVVLLLVLLEIEDAGDDDAGEDDEDDEGDEELHLALLPPPVGARARAAVGGDARRSVRGRGEAHIWDRSFLARVLNMPAWDWSSSALASMLSSETQFWSASSIESCMTTLTASTLPRVAWIWSTLLRSSYLAASLESLGCMSPFRPPASFRFRPLSALDAKVDLRSARSAAAWRSG